MFSDIHAVLFDLDGTLLDRRRSFERFAQDQWYRFSDPEIFRRALAQLQADPARSVFVGDNPEADIAGARGVGMRAVWLRDPTGSQQVEADASIEDVADLLPLLGVRAERPNQPLTTNH